MKNDATYLAHIAEALDLIIDFTSDGRAAFMEDKKTQDAVIRNFEIIGEAAKLVSSGLKKEHPEIPWREMAGTRDRLIHEYFGVSLVMIWRIVEQEVPQLRMQIAALLGRNK